MHSHRAVRKTAGWPRPPTPSPAWQLHGNGLSSITCSLKPYHPVRNAVWSQSDLLPPDTPTSLSGIQWQGRGVYFASLAVLGTQKVPTQSSVTMRVCTISPRLLSGVFSHQDVPLQDHLNAKRARFHQRIFRNPLSSPSCFCQVAQRCLWCAGSECKLRR